MNSLGITKEIQEASVAAATLKTQLENATNVNTGKLDLGRFNQSLKESGYQIKDSFNLCNCSWCHITKLCNFDYAQPCF